MENKTVELANGHALKRRRAVRQRKIGKIALVIAKYSANLVLIFLGKNTLIMPRRRK